MTAEEKLHDSKREPTPEYIRRAMKRNTRVTMLALTGALTISILFFAYAMGEQRKKEIYRKQNYGLVLKNNDVTRQLAAAKVQIGKLKQILEIERKRAAEMIKQVQTRPSR